MSFIAKLAYGAWGAGVKTKNAFVGAGSKMADACRCRYGVVDGKRTRLTHEQIKIDQNHEKAHGTKYFKRDIVYAIAGTLTAISAVVKFAEYNANASMAPAIVQQGETMRKHGKGEVKDN